MTSKTPWPKDPAITGLRLACSIKARHRIPSLDHVPELNRWADDLGGFVPAVLSELYIEVVVDHQAQPPLLSQLVARAREIKAELGLSRRAAE